MKFLHLVRLLTWIGLIVGCAVAIGYAIGTNNSNGFIAPAVLLMLVLSHDKGKDHLMRFLEKADTRLSER